MLVQSKLFIDYVRCQFSIKQKLNVNIILFRLPDLSRPILIDILNLYPLIALQDNYVDDELAQEFLAQNLERVANDLQDGYHQKELIQFIA